MQGNRNPNTRAIVSALQCDYRSLRYAAVQIVDAILAMSGPRGREQDHIKALTREFKAHRNTAVAILRAREGVTKTGARKR